MSRHSTNPWVVLVIICLAQFMVVLDATIDRWVHPDEFRWFREQGEALGFGSVFSGPLVRSSYRADEQRHAAASGRGAVAY